MPRNPLEKRNWRLSAAGAGYNLTATAVRRGLPITASSVEQLGDRLLVGDASDSLADQRRDATVRTLAQLVTSSGCSMELVITSSFRSDLVTRSTAGPDSTPWVT